MGEAFGHSIAPATKVTIDSVLTPAVLGSDPADIAGISHRANRALHMFGRNGTLAYGLSGSTSPLDIAGKVAGVPIYRLLGGSTRTEVDAYASRLVPVTACGRRQGKGSGSPGLSPREAP